MRSPAQIQTAGRVAKSEIKSMHEILADMGYTKRLPPDLTNQPCTTTILNPMKTLDQICSDAAKTAGVHFDLGWHTFDNVAVTKVRALYDALVAGGAFPPVVPPVVVPPVPVPPTPAEVVSVKLGPTFAALNPNALDVRPTHYRPESIAADPEKFGDRVNPYEIGATSGPAGDHDYWTSVGQVAYIPDESVIGDAGLNRIQSFAYYSHVFAISPRYEGLKSRMGREEFADKYWVNGVNTPLIHPVCCVRNYAMLSNEALIVYANGFVGCAGTQTSRGGAVPFDWPLPGLQLPKNKVPLAIALTTSNEFALITVQDLDTGKGQIAVIALEAHCIPFHTWPWICMPNQGSWSDFVLMGFVDLPFASPDAIASASNGFWGGPSETVKNGQGQVLSQIDITDPNTRWGLREGEFGWQKIVAKGGYCIVSSKTAGKVAIVDLAPLFRWVRAAYLDEDKQTATLAARAAKTWPGTLSAANMPKVIWTTDVTKPTAVLAGLVLERWTPDRWKAYIASEDGTIQIVDTSSLMKRWDFEQTGALGVMNSFKVGKNPVSMCFARFKPDRVPLLPNDAEGVQRTSDPLNNIVYVACRGDRRIDTFVSYRGDGAIYQTISDTRLGDPVHVSVADRGNIVTVCDYSGKKIVSYRIGALYDRVEQWGQVGKRWDAGAPGALARFECAGELVVSGYPFWSGTSNLN